MKWNKYTLKTTTQMEEWIGGILLEAGISSFEVEDHTGITEEEKKAMYADILPVLPEDDGTAYISFYLQVDDGETNPSLVNDGVRIKEDEILDEKEVLEKVRAGLLEIKDFVDIGEATITKRVTEDIDWMNNWKKFFKPFKVDNILIKPTWEEIPAGEEESMIIEIDPGTAFGTGLHETTKLCIHSLQKYVKNGDKVLDLGCGSGILSIVAAKLGAGGILATDIDENAVEAAKENARHNQTDGHYQVYHGNVLEDEALREKLGTENDIVVANILAEVIVMLADTVDRYMKKGAVFISSGILYTKEQEVTEAIQNNPHLELKEILKEGDWVSIVAVRI